jgi:nitroimidazol reductase NimA-like FMN-containing flavoprotein (pyridoxamine 5'-phosphate oxidase superfamily)
MRDIRRKEKIVTDKDEKILPFKIAKYVTIAMCEGDEPYLVTLSHGYDEENNRIYFHCAKEGKKGDILKKNRTVWGQVLLDKGYQQGSCDHLYHTTQFKGQASFVEDVKEKKRALKIMIKQLEEDPDKVIERQVKPDSVNRVYIGRIDIDYISSKKSEEIIISL